jgi:hypothetical protein
LTQARGYSRRAQVDAVAKRVAPRHGIIAVPSVSRSNLIARPVMSRSSEPCVRSHGGSTADTPHLANVLWFIVLVLVLLFVVVIALALVLLVVIVHVIAGGLGGRRPIYGGAKHRAHQP